MAIDGQDRNARSTMESDSRIRMPEPLAQGIVCVPWPNANGLEPEVFSRNLLSPKHFLSSDAVVVTASMLSDPVGHPGWQHLRRPDDGGRGGQRSSCQSQEHETNELLRDAEPNAAGGCDGMVVSCSRVGLHKGCLTLRNDVRFGRMKYFGGGAGAYDTERWRLRSMVLAFLLFASR